MSMAGLMKFPPRYELCFVPLGLSFVVNIFLSIQVAMGRKKYNVQYPNLYAVPGFHKDADAFNCIQRAHQNTLESMSPVLIATFACGLVYPVAAACSGTIYMLGRVVYGYGYAMGNPAYRTPGGILSHVGDMPLMGMALRIAYNAIVDNA